MKILDIEKMAPNILKLARINVKDFLAGSTVDVDGQIEDQHDV